MNRGLAQLIGIIIAIILINGFMSLNKEMYRLSRISIPDPYIRKACDYKTIIPQTLYTPKIYRLACDIYQEGETR